MSQLAVAVASDEGRRGLLVSRDKGQELARCGGRFTVWCMSVCVCVRMYVYADKIEKDHRGESRAEARW